MSIQEKIHAWVEEIKKYLLEHLDRNEISVPFLQSHLLCSYSQGLMIRDALIKEGVIEADANGNQYPLTEAYQKSRPTPKTQATEVATEERIEQTSVEASISAPDPTDEAIVTEKPRRKKTTSRRAKKEEAPSFPPLSDDDVLLYALAISPTEAKVFNQILIYGKIDRPGGQGSTLESVSEEEGPLLRDLLRLEANGLIACEKDSFVLHIYRRSGVLIYQTCRYIENSSMENAYYIKSLLKKSTRSLDEINTLLQAYDNQGMKACGDAFSTFDRSKFELLEKVAASLLATEETAENEQIDPPEASSQEESREENTPPTEADIEAVTTETTTAEQPQTPSHPTAPVESTSSVSRTAPTQLTVDTYTQEQVQKYQNPQAVDTFCQHIWQDMLLHLCVKGFNETTGKYLPMLQEKNALPPSLAAYLQAHELTPDTPCLPMSANDLQTSLQDFGLFAMLEILKDRSDITRTQVIELIAERVRALRNTYLLSNVAVDSFQSVRTALRNSSDEAFEKFKEMIKEII